MNERSPPLNLPLDIVRIQKLLPHRYPFLLVDRVIALEPDQSITTLKNVTINEQFFKGHFPDYPVMPGVLLIEAMAQSAGLLTLISLDLGGHSNSRALFYLAKVNNARFNAPVVPGDQLRIEVRMKRLMRNMGLFEAHTMVADREVSSCELMCAARDEP